MSDRHDAGVEQVIIECPKCGTQGEVPAWWLGNETECKSCEYRFTPTIPKGVVADAE